MYKHLFIFSLIVFSFAACKKKTTEPSTATDTGELLIYFENMVGDQDLILTDDYDTTWYQNFNGDEFTVSRYTYYVTDVRLVNENGNKFQDESLNFLIKAEDEMTHFTEFDNIPLGRYTQVELTLGVDSIYNVTGSHGGVFDPIHGMYWDWNTGYIMAKFEGNSPVSPAFQGMVAIHLGGYKGKFSSIRKVILDLPETLEIKENGIPELIFKSDLLEWFKGEPAIDFSEFYAVMEEGGPSLEIANRYQNHISVKEVKND